jgi:2-polyprenyl-3-methyl-5-hydroxy-6-metoxy-1,4-benzoquinol methylase
MQNRTLGPCFAAMHRNLIPVIAPVRHLWLLCFKVTAVDYSPDAIAEARSRATAAGVDVDFRVGNAFDLGEAVGGASFDSVLDSALWHCFTDDDQTVYLKSLTPLVRPCAVCVCWSRVHRWSMC